METYLAILFFLLITVLIILINAILCRTWTDLAELLIIAAVWSIFFVWDIFLPAAIIAGTIITVWNSFIIWKERKQNNHFLLEKAWIRLCVIPTHFLVGGFFVAFWKLTEQM